MSRDMLKLEDGTEVFGLHFTDATGAQWEIRGSEEGILIQGLPHQLSRLSLLPVSHASIIVSNSWKKD